MAWAAWVTVGVAGKVTNAKTACDEGLLKSNLAHGFCAEDFADVEALHSGSAALVFGAHSLLDNGIHLVSQIIECCPVGIFDQD
jgi:hypothetical protein